MCDITRDRKEGTLALHIDGVMQRGRVVNCDHYGGDV